MNQFLSTIVQLRSKLLCISIILQNCHLISVQVVMCQNKSLVLSLVIQNVVTETTELYSLKPVLMTLTFI